MINYGYIYMTNDMDVFPHDTQDDEFFNNLEPRSRTLLPAQERPLTRTTRSLLSSAEQLHSIENGEGVMVGDAAAMVKDRPVVLAFADGLSADKRQAAMDATLFAEIYADEKADRGVNGRQWQEHYRLAMRQAGWFMGSEKTQSYETRNTYITMDSIVLDIISKVAGANAAALLPLLGDVFDFIKNDGKLITLFDNNSQKDGSSNCRIIPSLETENGIGVSMFIGIEYKFLSGKGGSLFWKWDTSSVQIETVATMVNWNFERYLRNRERIMDYIGADSESFFEAIQVGR
ncbi:MAG: hypothetical protein RR619_09000 [Raoultibacter sp.]